MKFSKLGISLNKVRFVCGFFLGLFWSLIPLYFVIFPVLHRLVQYELFGQNYFGHIANNLFLIIFTFGGFTVSWLIFIFLKKKDIYIAWGCLVGGFLGIFSLLASYVYIIMSVT